ncbi:hypothetical protein Gotur_017511 [Gossypium turneri]
MLHGVGLLYLEEVYCTVKVARFAQDDCGPTSGFITYTVTGSSAVILILTALLRCYYWQLCCDISVLAGWVDFISIWCVGGTEGEEVPITHREICEFYDVPFYDKDFLSSTDLDKFENINMEDVIKYLTQGKQIMNWNQRRKENMNDPVSLKRKGKTTEYPGTEAKYEVAFQPQFSTPKWLVIWSPTHHALSTGRSSHQKYIKGKGKEPMEMRRAPHWDGVEED